MRGQPLWGVCWLPNGALCGSMAGAASRGLFLCALRMRAGSSLSCAGLSSSDNSFSCGSGRGSANFGGGRKTKDEITSDLFSVQQRLSISARAHFESLRATRGETAAESKIGRQIGTRGLRLLLPARGRLTQVSRAAAIAQAALRPLVARTPTAPGWPPPRVPRVDPPSRLGGRRRARALNESTPATPPPRHQHNHKTNAGVWHMCLLI